MPMQLHLLQASPQIQKVQQPVAIVDANQAHDLSAIGAPGDHACGQDGSTSRAEANAIVCHQLERLIIVALLAFEAPAQVPLCHHS